MKIGTNEPRPLERLSALPVLDQTFQRIALENTLRKRARIILRMNQAWLLLLIVGSIQPARLGQGVALHHGIHWLAFAGTAFLLLLLSRNRREEIRSAIAACLLGLSLEYMQHLVYRNPMEWRDVRDDILAVLAAFVLYRFTSTRNPASAPPD